MSRKQHLSNLELIEEIDQGWRYFWKKRGFDEPPSLVDPGYEFGGKKFDFKNEEKSAKKGEQETPKGVPRVQEIRE